MGAPTFSFKRMLLYSVLLTLCIFSVAAVAADSTTEDTDAASTSTDVATSTSSSTDATSSTTSSSDAPSTSTSTTDSKSETSSTSTSTTDSPKSSTSTSTTDSQSSTSTSTTASSTTTTSSSSSSSTTDASNMPSITSSVSSSSSSSATSTSSSSTSIPAYPAPTVPNTENAPFMNRSKAPDGTVFIAVGAILGAFGAGILIWRGVVACLLHRSVKKAAMAQHAANDKAAFPMPPAPFYKYHDRESSPSVGAGGASGRGQRRSRRGPIPSETPSQTNLFFSPTAPAGAGGPGGAGNRDSRFLPSGFYAAASATPSPGHGNSISLSNLQPAPRGQLGPSPPDSPSLGSRGGAVGSRNFSTSSFNLSHIPGERAPSAYLDDLLDDNPGAFPPPSHHRNVSGSSHGWR